MFFTEYFKVFSNKDKGDDHHHRIKIDLTSLGGHSVNRIEIGRKCTGSYEGVHIDDAVFETIVGTAKKDPSGVEEYRSCQNELGDIENVFKVLLHSCKVAGIVGNGDPHDIHGPENSYENTGVVGFLCLIGTFFL